MKKIPKYINKKIDRLEKLLEQALSEKIEIEKWAEKNGIDTTSNEWYNKAIDDVSGINGIYKEGLFELLEELHDSDWKNRKICYTNIIKGAIKIEIKQKVETACKIAGITVTELVYWPVDI